MIHTDAFGGKMIKMSTCIVSKYFDDICEELGKSNMARIHDLSDRILACSEKGGKIIIVGNGGSAAIASHVTVDLTKTCNIRAVNFNEADLLTCFSNDYGYENWVVEALKSYMDQQDLVILISSSGNSMNMVNASKFLNEKLIEYATFTGFQRESKINQISSNNFWVNSGNYNVVEMVHQIWLLSIVEKLSDQRI